MIFSGNLGWRNVRVYSVCLLHILKMRPGEVKWGPMPWLLWEVCQPPPTGSCLWGEYGGVGSCVLTPAPPDGEWGSYLPHLTSPHLTYLTFLTSPHLISSPSPHLIASHLPHLPHLTPPHLTSFTPPHLTSSHLPYPPHVTSLHLISPHLISSHLTYLTFLTSTPSLHLTSCCK